MTLVLQTDRKRRIFGGFVALVFLGFGTVLFRSVPADDPFRHAFLVLPVAASLVALGNLLRRRVVVSAQGVGIRRLFTTEFIPLGELKDWKIKANQRRPSLHLTTHAGREVVVDQLGMLGVRDVAETSRRIAEALRG